MDVETAQTQVLVILRIGCLMCGHIDNPLPHILPAPDTQRIDKEVDTVSLSHNKPPRTRRKTTHPLSHSEQQRGLTMQRAEDPERVPLTSLTKQYHHQNQDRNPPECVLGQEQEGDDNQGHAEGDREGQESEHNKKDEKLVARVIACIKEGIGDETLIKVVSCADKIPVHFLPIRDIVRLYSYF